MPCSNPSDVPCFIDTQVFVSANFNPSSKPIGIMRYLAAHRHIHLLLPSVTKSELFKHLKAKTINECIALEKADRAATALKFVGSQQAREVYFKINTSGHQDSIARSVARSFNTFLNELHVKHLSCESVLLKDVMEDHFENRPPFSKTKPNEFKDAAVVHAIRDYVNDNDIEKLIVVSNDMDFHRAFEHDCHYELFKNLNDLASKYPDQQFVGLVAEVAEEGLNADLKSELDSYVSNIGMFTVQVEGNIDLIETKYDIPDPLVLSAQVDNNLLEDGSGSKLVLLDLWWDISVTMFMCLEYEVPGTGIYDKEDGVLYFPETDTEKTHRTLQVPLHAQVEIEISDECKEVTQIIFDDLGPSPDLYIEPRCTQPDR